jgi:hypothetical protein
MPPTEHPPDAWDQAHRLHEATKAEALESVTEAGERWRTAIADLTQARRDLRLLCAAVADSKIANKTEIAHAAGIHRSKLYPSTTTREVTP